VNDDGVADTALNDTVAEDAGAHRGRWLALSVFTAHRDVDSGAVKGMRSRPRTRQRHCTTASTGHQLDRVARSARATLLLADNAMHALYFARRQLQTARPRRP